jgi:hypothetical protein
MSYSKAEQLHQYILSLPDFHLVSPEEVGGGGYEHMGAILVDSILQANANWKTIVKPRVEFIRRLYGDLPTTSDFSALLYAEGANPFETLLALLDWGGPEKPQRLLRLLALLQEEGIETVDELRAWLVKEDTEAKLRALRGIGPKTVDYLKIMAGLDSVAIDLHWKRFLKSADLPVRPYNEVAKIVIETAVLMGVPAAVLDHSVWKYMTSSTVSR